MTGSLYQRKGDLLYPTPHTRGPWSADAQHGAAIGALMARAVDLTPSIVPMQLSQLSIDMTRKVPMAPVRTEVDVVRDGKRVQALAVRLLADDLEIGRATAVRIRVVDGIAAGPHVGVPYDVDALPPPPEAGHPVSFAQDEVPGFFDLMQVVGVDHGAPQLGHSTWWYRFHGQVVEGEELTPLVRVGVTADLIRSTAEIMGTDRYLTINPDLTILPHRMPEGEWIGISSYARAEANGVGQSEGVLFDRRGRLGRSVKSQLIDPR